MAISVVDEGIVSGSADGTTQTWSITVTGGDILVIAFAITRASSNLAFQTPHTATYNGSAMTLEGFYGVVSSTNRWHGHAFGYIVSPATGTNSVVLTADIILNGGQQLYFWTLTGVDTADPFGANNSTDGTDTMSVSVSTTVVDSWVLAMASAGDSTNPSVGSIAWTSPTAEVATAKPQWFDVSFGKREVTSTGSYVIEATETGLSAMALSAIVLNPASAGSTQDVSMAVGRSIGTLAEGGAVAGAGMALGVAAVVQSGKTAQASTTVTAALAQMLVQIGETAAVGITTAGRVVDVAAGRTVVATASVNFERLAGASAAALATEAAAVVLDRLAATNVSGSAGAMATVTVTGLVQCGVNGDVLAAGALALLANLGVMGVAQATGDGGVEIAAVQAAGVDAGSVAWAAATVALLHDLAAGGVINGAAQTVEVDLALVLQADHAMQATTIAASATTLLSYFGFEAVAVAGSEASTQVQFSLTAGVAGGVTLAGAITLTPTYGVTAAGGRRLAATLTVAQNRSSALLGQRDIGGSVGLLHELAATLAGRAVALGVSELVVEWQVSPYGATALFAVGEGRLFVVPAHHRRLSVDEHDRFFVVA